MQSAGVSAKNEFHSRIDSLYDVAQIFWGPAMAVAN